MTGIVTEEFKMTELGPLPPEWEVAKLGDVARVTSGGSAPQGKEFFGGGNPFIRVQHLELESDTIRRWDLITDRAVNKCGLRLYPKGTIVFPKSGASIYLEKRAILPGDAYIVSHLCAVISQSPLVDQNFLFYFLRFTRLSEHKAEGYPTLNLTEVKERKIVCPPLSEQKNIAYVLSSVQAAIEKTEAVIEATSEVRKSLMKHLFTYGPVSIDEAENVPLKETTIGLVPEGWEVAKLGNVARTQYGYTTSACHDNVGPQFLRITDIDDDGNVNWSTVPFCMVSLDDFQKFCLEDGDTVVARIGATTGKTYFVEDPPRSVFASYLIRLKVKDRDKVYPAFIGAFTKSSPYWTQVNQSKGEKLKAGLSARQLEQILIPLPPLQVQQRSIIALSVTEKKLEAERNKKATLQVLFNTMLSNLMTGRTRVNSLEVSA